MEQTNNQEVKYNLPNEEEQKKKNRRITGIFVLLTTIVIDVCSLLAYFATLKDKENNWYEKPQNVIGLPLNPVMTSRY